LPTTIDVAATRAALAYVPDKSAALREFHRVLKAGGRISLAEPILQDDAFFARALRKRVESQTGESQDRFLTLLHRWKAALLHRYGEVTLKEKDGAFGHAKALKGYFDGDIFILDTTGGLAAGLINAASMST